MSHLNPPPNRIPISMYTAPDVKAYLNKQKEAIRLLYYILDSPMTSVRVYSVKTANYTITDEDYLIHYTTGTFTATFPDASAVQTGTKFAIKNSGTGTITVDCFGSQTIDDVTTKLLAQYDSITVMSTGTGWIII